MNGLIRRSRTIIVALLEYSETKLRLSVDFSSSWITTYKIILVRLDHRFDVRVIYLSRMSLRNPFLRIHIICHRWYNTHLIVIIATWLIILNARISGVTTHKNAQMFIVHPYNRNYKFCPQNNVVTSSAKKRTNFLFNYIIYIGYNFFL